MQTKCNRKNGQPKHNPMRYPQMPQVQHRIPHTPTSKQAFGKVVDAGVAIGAMAIGASVVTGVVGAITKK